MKTKFWTMAVIFMSAVLLLAQPVCAKETYTGLKKHNNVWTFFENGEPDYSKQGLVQYESEWFYLTDGVMDTKTKGFMRYNGGHFFVGAGRVISESSGLVQHEGKWYFLARGQWQKNHRDMALYDKHWFVLDGGILDDAYNGIYWYNGGRFLVAAGQIKSEYTGLYKEQDTWFYIINGQVSDYTGLVKYDGAWFYVEKGILADWYTGEVEYDGSTFYVEKGAVAEKPTVIPEHEHVILFNYRQELQLDSCTVHSRLVDICSVCGYVEKLHEDYGTTFACVLSNLVWLGQPFCTEDVQYTQYCIKCGKQGETKTQEAAGHSFEDVGESIQVKATCTDTGIKLVKKECNNCPEVVYEEVEYGPEPQNHVDANRDAKCDGCGVVTEPPKEDEGDITEPPKEDEGDITEPPKEDEGDITEPPKDENEGDTTQPPKEEIEYDDSVFDTISDILDDLQAAGVIAVKPESVTTTPVLSGSNVEIESVETYKNKFIVVTLNGQLTKTNTADITINKYKNNWYAQSASTTKMNKAEDYVTINDEGKTVIIYRVTDKIDGTKTVIDTSAKKFSDLETAITTAENYMSWQMDHGGWDKGVENQAKEAWNGKDKKNKFSGWTGKNGEMLGTIDNDATYTQMRHIAAVYREVKDERYQESVLKGLDFIFKLQYQSGGMAQVYPRRGGYSDMATFNDNAMVNVLIMLEDMRDGLYPFDSDIITDEYMVKVEESIAKAIDFILKSQLTQNGKLTAWCAQHDPVTYKAVGARAFELPSISGSESVGIVKFLIHQEQTPEIKLAVESAIQWFKDSEAKGIKYVKNDPNEIYFVEDAGSTLWYRFYEIETNRPLFGDRDGLVHYSIAEISEERRNGYSWSGTYPKKLLEVYEESGNYEGRIEALVTATNSTTANNKKLKKGSVTAVETEIIITR